LDEVWTMYSKDFEFDTNFYFELMFVRKMHINFMEKHTVLEFTLWRLVKKRCFSSKMLLNNFLFQFIWKFMD